ncbi:hypothetical protein ACSSS7_007202 [Eimeria intestinalis]
MRSDCATSERQAEAMPPQRESRARDNSAAVAAVSSSSSSNSSSGAARHDKTSLRGSSARGRSSEPSDAAEGSSSERAAGATSSSARRNGGRSRHGAATPAAASADASSSSSSNSKRRQSPEHNNRRIGGGVRRSSRMHQTGGSVDRRRSSSGSLNSNCTDEQEEEATCPLCMEALDETDRGLFPCECGYQAGRVCLWCLHHIRDHLANKCPACRRDYDEKKFKYDQSRVVELTKQVGRKSRDKVCGSSDATRSGSSGAGSSSSRSACTAAPRSGGPVSSSSCGAASSSSSSSSKGAGPLPHAGGGSARHGSREAAVAAPAQAAALKDVRVIQRCLVYVIGIPPSIAKKEILRRREFFGQYGKVLQIVINKNQGHWGGPSYAVYVTYATSKEAVAAIQGVDGAVYEGKTLKASFGTTNSSSSSSFSRNFTKEAMISAKHQFLDLTFPSTSERKPMATSFGKLPDSRSRNAQGFTSEEAEGQGDAAENGEAGLGADSGDDSDAFSDSAPRRGFGKTSAGSGVSSSAGSAAAAAAATPAPAAGGPAAEGEDTQKAGRDSKAKAKPQGPPCSTWASVAAGSAKPTAAAAAAAASSASMPASASHAKSQGSAAAASPGLSASQPAQQQQQQQQQRRRQQQQQEVEETDRQESDSEQLDEDDYPSVQSPANGASNAAEEGFSEIESQAAQAEVHSAEASPKPSAAIERSSAAEAAEVAAAMMPAQADDEGMARQQQQQQQHHQQRQHEQQEPPQQLPSWPCFHPSLPQRPLGSAMTAASGLQGSLLDAVGAPVLPPTVSAAGAAAAPHQLQPLPAAQQQQQPMLQQPQQPQRAVVLAALDASSLSPTEQLMQQLQQKQQLRLCPPDRILLGADQMDGAGSRFGAPPGLEGLGGPSGSNRGCRPRSRSNSSGSLSLKPSVFALPGMGHLGPAGAAAGCRPFADEAAPGACAGVASNSSNGGSRFAFASAACEEEDALFEIPGVEDCVLWLSNPSAQIAASAAAAEAAAAAVAQQQQQQQGHSLRSSERVPLVDPGGGGVPLPSSLANNWTQQRPPSKDFVFGPGVGGASLPTLQQPQQQQRQQQQQQQQQRQPLERWRPALQQQHPAGVAMQGKALAGTAAAGASVFDRFDSHSARRTGWNSFDRFSDPQQQQQQQQQQLQHEQLQQLLGQQHQMLLQQFQQQPQARSRGAAALPVPPEQQQPHLLVQQQQQQQQQLALLQQLLPAACALGRGGSALPADPEEALKLLLSLIPNSANQAQRQPLQQQPSQPRYGDASNNSSSSSNAGFAIGTSGSRERDASGRARTARVQGGAALPRGAPVGGPPCPLPVSRNVQELGATDGFWGAAAAAAAAAASATPSESSRGRSAARRGSGCSGEVGDRGPAFTSCGTGSYPHFDSQLSDTSQCSGASSARAGGGLPPSGGLGGAPLDAAALHPVCATSPPAAHAGSSELLPFLQRQRMQQLQQQKLQQLQRALESQRLE